VGEAIDIHWELSPDDRADVAPRSVVGYRVERATATADQTRPADSQFAVVGETPYGTTYWIDRGCQPGEQYWYRVAALGLDGQLSPWSVGPQPAEATLQFFDHSRLWFAILLGGVCGGILYCIRLAQSGRPLKIRKIAGLQAVDEAVGRATEMGKSCLFVPGVIDINDMQTVAGLTLLGRVARTAAEYETKIQVPTSRSLVMAAGRETMQGAYLAAGHPEACNPDDVSYITDEQFGYVAGITGTMVREKPAACFYLGCFFAESLFLAEAGNSIGAIQIAGTAESTQLPFFVAACDYTLIGEEFFAASAYLSGEPQQLGTLKGQDLGKVCGAALLIGGVVLATAAQVFPDWGMVGTALSYLQIQILGTG
jgi:hypothetical protein